MIDPEQTPPKQPMIIVCVNKRFRMDQASCAMSGSHAIADALEAGIKQHSIDIKIERILCFGHCMDGPVLRIAPGGRFIHHMEMDQVNDLLSELKATYGTVAKDTILSGNIAPGL